MNTPAGVTVNPVPCGVTWTPDAAFGRGFPTLTVIAASLPGEKVSGLWATVTLSGVSSTRTGTG